MSEKNIALVILAIVVIIAVVGLILVFTGTAGAVTATQKAYPGGVIAPTEAIHEYPTGYTFRYYAPQEELTVQKAQLPGAYYPTVNVR